MTNTILLDKCIKSCGLTKAQFAGALGISRQSLYKKLANITEFKQSEMQIAVKVLNLSADTSTQIFFGVDVDK